ncbi:unnamed protein product [Auanema sp. JU1783]|nr:unnamed protein product [Auanema sp. JU1783]
MFEEAESKGILSLIGRQLKELPISLTDKYDISDIVLADLSNNRFSDIPAALCDLRSLETLRIQQNALRHVPTNISHLISLSFLDLSNNQLSQLPLALFELPLCILLLTGNRLDTIPREIRQLSSTLTELDLSYNFLNRIPADIALLKMLRVLCLKKNLLDQFPSELCRLSLHTLDLSSNRFTHLPLHIRKMKTLIEFHISDNPLQSPPADIVSKGREHVFKWMDNASGGCDTLPAHLLPNSSITLKALNLGKNGVNKNISESDMTRKSSAPAPLERRSRSHRFHTITGSDSGYGSTADEHRLSHEIPSGGLDGITEFSPFSQESPDGSSDLVEASEESTSLDSLNEKMPDKKNHNDIRTNVDQKKVKMLSSMNQSIPKENTVPNSSSLNGNVPISAKEPPNSLDISNNNTCRNKDVTTRGTSHSQNVILSTTTKTKPVSKVAPLMNTTKGNQNVSSEHAKNSLTKVSTTSLPKKTVNGTYRTREITSSRTVSTPISTKPVSASSVSNISNPTRLRTMTGSRVPLSSSANSSIIKRPATTAPTSRSGSIVTKSASSEPNSMEQFRKLFEEKIGVTLPPGKDSISAALADGVHLCTLANALRTKAITTILNTTENESLTPLKCKKNAESFVSACKKVGVTEACLCSSSDITTKRNLVSIVKTVAQLNRLTSAAVRPTTKVVTSRIAV